MGHSGNTVLDKPGLLTEGEMGVLETTYPDGMTSAEIVNVFSRRGIKFSEATLRKYVQQGLLPRSQRIGQKGKHKGSKGIYPTSSVRQINEIKRLMSMDYTIEEILNQFAFVDGELEELRTLLGRIVDKLEKSARYSAIEGLAIDHMSRQLDEAKSTAGQLIGQLEQTVRQIRERAHIARNAV